MWVISQWETHQHHHYSHHPPTHSLSLTPCVTSNNPSPLVAENGNSPTLDASTTGLHALSPNGPFSPFFSSKNHDQQKPWDPYPQLAFLGWTYINLHTNSPHRGLFKTYLFSFFTERTAGQHHPPHVITRVKFKPHHYCSPLHNSSLFKVMHIINDIPFPLIWHNTLFRSSNFQSKTPTSYVLAAVRTSIPPPPPAAPPFCRR